MQPARTLLIEVAPFVPMRREITREPTHVYRSTLRELRSWPGTGIDFPGYAQAGMPGARTAHGEI